MCTVNLLYLNHCYLCELALCFRMSRTKNNTNTMRSFFTLSQRSRTFQETRAVKIYQCQFTLQLSKLTITIPSNTIYSPNASLMLAQRR